MNSMKAAIEQTAESQAALEAEIREKDADAQALEVLSVRSWPGCDPPKCLPLF